MVALLRFRNHYSTFRSAFLLHRWLPKQLWKSSSILIAYNQQHRESPPECYALLTTIPVFDEFLNHTLYRRHKIVSMKSPNLSNRSSKFLFLSFPARSDLTLMILRDFRECSQLFFAFFVHEDTGFAIHLHYEHLPTTLVES